MICNDRPNSEFVQEEKDRSEQAIIIYGSKPDLALAYTSNIQRKLNPV